MSDEGELVRRNSLGKASMTFAKRMQREHMQRDWHMDRHYVIMQSLCKMRSHKRGDPSYEQARLDIWKHIRSDSRRDKQRIKRQREKRQRTGDCKEHLQGYVVPKGSVTNSAQQIRVFERRRSSPEHQHRYYGDRLRPL